VATSATARYPGERELQRRDPPRPPRVEQRPPGVAAARALGVHGGEVELGEDDVEPGEELRVLEPARLRVGEHGAGDGEVEVVEAGDAVGRRESGGDRLHARDHAADRVDHRDPVLRPGHHGRR
jgi:hypothetical protein